MIVFPSKKLNNADTFHTILPFNNMNFNQRNLLMSDAHEARLNLENYEKIYKTTDKSRDPTYKLLQQKFLEKKHLLDSFDKNQKQSNGQIKGQSNGQIKGQSIRSPSNGNFQERPVRSSFDGNFREQPIRSPSNGHFRRQPVGSSFDGQFREQPVVSSFNRHFRGQPVESPPSNGHSKWQHIRSPSTNVHVQSQVVISPPSNGHTQSRVVGDPYECMSTGQIIYSNTLPDPDTYKMFYRNPRKRS